MEKILKTKNWSIIKNEIYGENGTPRRDGLDRDFESFFIGLQLLEISKIQTQERRKPVG